MIKNIIQLHGKNWPCDGPSELTVIKTLSMVQKIQKPCKTHLLQQFEDSDFHIPVPQLSNTSADIIGSVWAEGLQCHVQARQSLLENEHDEAMRST